MIKRFLASIFAILFLASEASAGFLINSFQFAAGTPTLTFLQCDQDFPGTNTITITGANTGAEAGNRSTIIGIVMDDNVTAFGTNSVTVGGDAAAEVVDEGGVGSMSASIYIMSNPSGTSEDVIVTASESVDGAYVCLWAAYGLNSNTAVAFTADDQAAAANLVLTLSATQLNGIAIGVCGTDANSTTATWTGLTENTPETGGGGSNMASSAQNSNTNGSSLTIGCDWSGSANSAGVSASFR